MDEFWRGRLTELHLHLDGSLSPAMARELARIGGQSLNYSDDELVSRLNGVEMNRVKGVKTPKGAIALQSEGGAIEFRSVSVEE